MESQSLICQQQAPHLQQQCQICTFVWIWNVESHKCHLKQIANLHQPMSVLHLKHPLVSQSPQSRSLVTRKTRHNPDQIGRRKCRWISYSPRKPTGKITSHAPEWNPQGKGCLGRPKMTWRKSCEEEMKAYDVTWGELIRTAQNRVRCRIVAEALCSTRNPRE